MGYSLLAFSSSSVMGVEMLLFYLVVYMLAGLSTWFIILSLRLNTKLYPYKFNKELGDLVLLRKSNPALAFSFALIMFSIAGIPPLIGFLAKLGVFLSLLYVQYFIVALFSVICSVISTFYYIRIIKILYFENFLTGKLYFPITTNKTLLFSILVFCLLFLFINPTFLYLVIHKSVWYSFFDSMSFFV